MRMAEFLKATGLRIDAARYYIALGLLAPSKHNGKFVFSPSDVRDANDLQTLLHLGASLQESKPILFEARVSGEPFFKSETFQALLPQLQTRAKSQKDHEQKREEDLASYAALVPTEPVLRGFPLSALFSLFEKGNLSADSLLHNEVLTGNLEVGGRRLPITSGILCDGATPRFKEKIESLTSEQNFGAYLQSMPKESVDQVNAFFVALQKEIAASGGPNLIFDHAEGSDSIGGLLSRYPGQEIVLWGDSDIMRAKHALADLSARPIVYLCSKNNRTPFQSGCFSEAVDFFSDDIHAAKQGPELLPELARLLKPNGSLILCKIIAPGGPLPSEEDLFASTRELFALKKVYQSEPFLRSAWDFSFFPYAPEAKISLVIYRGQPRLAPR